MDTIDVTAFHDQIDYLVDGFKQKSLKTSKEQLIDIIDELFKAQKADFLINIPAYKDMAKMLSHKQISGDEEMNEMYLCVCHFILLYGHSINITKQFLRLLIHITKKKSFVWLTNENKLANQFEKYFYPLSSSFEVNMLNMYLFLLRTVKVMGLYCKKEDMIQYSLYIMKFLQDSHLPSIIMNNIEISNELLPKIMQSKRCIDDPIRYAKYVTTLSIIEVLLSISHFLPEKYRLNVNSNLITQNVYNSMQLIINNVDSMKNKSNPKLLEILHYLISIILTGTNKCDWLNSENDKNNWTILLVQLEVYLRSIYLSIDSNEEASKEIYDLLLLTVASIDNYTHPKYHNLLLQSYYVDSENKVSNNEKKDSVLYLVSITEFIQKYLNEKELDELIMNRITYNQMNIYSKEIILMSHYVIMLSFSLKLNPILQFHILNALKDQSTVLFQKVLKLFLVIQKELALINKSLVDGVKLSINELQNLMKPTSV